MLNLRPIKLLPVREQAASSIREAIITRSLKQGQTLNIEATARALGVSATPVREAFQILARNGLIELAQNRSAVVVGFTEKTILEHYELRAALEAEACRLVCVNNAPLEGIEYCVMRSRNVLETNPEKYPDYNKFFHYEIWFAADNITMLNMLSELWDWLPSEFETTSTEYFKKSQAEHENIFWKLLQRDSSGAQDMMRSHIEQSMHDIITRCISPNTDPHTIAEKLS